MSLAVHALVLGLWAAWSPRAERLVRVRWMPDAPTSPPAPPTPTVAAVDPPRPEPRPADAVEAAAAPPIAPPEAPPVPEPEPPRRPEVVRVVHTEAPGQRPDQALAESRHDQDAEALRRSPVLSDRLGPTSPSSPASSAVGAAEAAVTGAPRPPPSAAPDPVPSPTAPPPPPAAASWWDTLRPYLPALPGAPWAAAEGGDRAPVAEPVPPVPVPPLPVPPLPVPAESNGEPVSEPRPAPPTEGAAPEAADAPPATPVPPRPESLATAPSEAPPHPPVDRHVDPSVDRPVDPPVAPAPEASDAERADAVADVAGTTLDGARAATVDAARAVASSHQTVIDAEVAEAPQVATRATDRGAWVQAIDEVVRAHWTDQEFPAHLAAMGVRGDTTVRFTVQPNGRTGEVTLVRRSGNETLDAIALAAIPERVPRMPAGIELVAIEHEITFRYR